MERVMMNAKRTRGVPVTTRAVIQRINRLLAAEGKELKKTRGILAERDLGDYYVCNSDSVLSHHVDLETLGREMGALQSYEVLTTEDM
jgi:hypothetical protein